MSPRPAATAARTRPPWLLPLAVALLVVDVALVALHLWHVAWGFWGASVPGWVQQPWTDISEETGLGENVTYVKVAAAGLLLVVAAVRRRAPVLAAWACLMGVVLADEYLMLHERLAGRVTSVVPVGAWLGLGSQNYGELLVWAGFAAVLVPLLVVTHLRSGPEARAISGRLVVLLVVLVVFAGAVDLVHAWVGEGRAGELVGTAESGGELVTISAILLVAAVAAAMPGWPGARPAPGHDSRAADGSPSPAESPVR